MKILDAIFKRLRCGPWGGGEYVVECALRWKQERHFAQWIGSLRSSLNLDLAQRTVVVEVSMEGVEMKWGSQAQYYDSVVGDVFELQQQDFDFGAKSQNGDLGYDGY